VLLLLAGVGVLLLHAVAAWPRPGRQQLFDGHHWALDQLREPAAHTTHERGGNATTSRSRSGVETACLAIQLHAVLLRHSVHCHGLQVLALWRGLPQVHQLLVVLVPLLLLLLGSCCRLRVLRRHALRSRHLTPACISLGRGLPLRGTDCRDAAAWLLAGLAGCSAPQLARLRTLVV
jgi:hypothetical protein